MRFEHGTETFCQQGFNQKSRANRIFMDSLQENSHNCGRQLNSLLKAAVFASDTGA